MRIPQFTADSSLELASGHYGTYHRTGRDSGAVVPQLQTQSSFASSCKRFCDCCRRGNRFCCSHCRWCSGPIGPYGVFSAE
jgi:hypothetical protein